MKVYVISNVPSGGDEILDALDGANVSVVGKEVQGDVGNAIDEIEKRVDSGNADFVIFVTDDILEASMQLNKVGDVRAAACNNSSDINAAMAKGANVVILDVDKANAADIARTISKSSGAMARPVPAAQRQTQQPRRAAPDRVVKRSEEQSYSEPQEQKQPITIKLEMPQMPSVSGLFKKKPQKQQQAQPKEEVQYPTGKPRKGLLGRIKDELGVLD